MANRPRVPATRKMPRLELLEMKCVPVSIIRDNAGKILGTGDGTERKVHSVEEFAEFLENCRKEITEANKQT